MSITITKEIDLEFYETHPYGQAILDRIINEGKVNEFEAILTDLYPEGIRESELDDMLRFEEDDICKWLDMRTEEQVKEDIEDKEDEIAKLEEAIEEDEMSILEGDYDEDEIADIEYDIADVKETLEELKEELRELRAELGDIRSYYRD